MVSRFSRMHASAVALAVFLALPACNKDKGDGPDKGGPPGRGSPQFRMSENNLKQIGLAIHNHNDSFGFLPVGIYGPDGKSIGLSWRVAILPFLEEEQLHKQFKLNEPWDSEHNKALISRMPKMYAAPTGKGEAGQTFYRAFAGKGTWLPEPGPGTPGTSARGLRFSDIKDGTSNTVFVAEAAEPVIWTKPDELRFEPSGPPPKIGGLFSDGANVLIGDGSVRFLPANTPPETLKALITIDGGEKVDLP